MSGGNVVFMPGVARCELCECAPARANFRGLWVCEACFDQVSAAPTPVVQTPACDDQRSGPSLAEIVERLVRGS